jgi:hypothetical protein
MGNGAVYVGAESLAPPATPGTAPATGWKELGYTTEDGATFTSDQTVTGVMAWQALGAIRNLVTDAPLSIKFTCIELTPWVVELAFGGGSVDGTTSKYTPPDPSVLSTKAVLVRSMDGTAVWDWYFPRTQLQASRDINLQRIQETRLPIEMGVLWATPRFTIAALNVPSWTGVGPLMIDPQEAVGSSKAA